MKKKKYSSEALMVIHQDMEAAYKLGLLTEEEMREFDEGCLVHEEAPMPRKAPAASRDKPVAPAYARPRE